MLEIVQIYDVSQNVKSLGLLEIIPDNRICGSIVNTEVYGSPPSKWKFWKSVFFHVRKGPNIGIKSNFQGPMTSNGWDYPGQPKTGRILTLRVMGSPP